MEQRRVLVSFVEKSGGFENERHRHPPAIGSNDNEENDQPIDLHRSTTSTSIGEKDDDKHELRRRLVHIEPKHQHQHQQQPLDLNINNVGGIKEEKIGGNSDREQSSSPEQGKIVSVNKPKIPRPANAFMLFANEWRKKLAVQNPRESNKDISVRLGALWKNMPKESKEKYFGLAREVDAEHKRKYPDYVYNPKEARLRKAMRDQTRSTITAATTTAAATANNNNNNSPSSLGVSLLEQQQQRMQTSSLMVHNNGNGSNSGAAINRSGPWFPAAATAAASTPPSSKSAYSPKHRTSTLDDKSKDGSRKQQQQQQDCSNQGCYPGQAYAADYHPVRLDASSSVAHQAATPPADYCSYNSGNLSSKWYPYQNGASNNNNNAYHSRNTLMSKINGYQQQQLRAAQQQQQQGAHAMRPLAHSAWGQFCNMPYQPNQSVLARANRHMFYLQEQYHQHHQQQQHQYQHQQQQQHRQLDYADGATAAAQMQSAFEAKMQDELARRLHATPPQEDSQSKNPLAQLQLSCSGIGDSSPKYCSSIIGASGSSSSLIEEAPRWSTPRPSSVSSSSCTTDTLFEREEPLLLPRKPSRCSKPLPGFQQAFGSTEIGKFSRSELFASLIEAAAAATSTVSTIGGQGDYGSSSSPEMDDASTSSASQQQQLHQGSAGWHAVGGEI